MPVARKGLGQTSFLSETRLLSRDVAVRNSQDASRHIELSGPHRDDEQGAAGASRSGVSIAQRRWLTSIPLRGL